MPSEAVRAATPLEVRGSVEGGSKLLLLVRSLEPGGAERQLVTLATGLHRRGRGVVVLAFYDRGALIEELRREGVPLRFVGKRGRWDLVGFAARLERCIREERPAILHSYLDVPNILAVLLRARFPGLRVVWGVRTAGPDPSHFDWMRRTTARVESAFARLAPLVIANSESGRAERIAAGWRAETIVTIPNGIDTERFQRDEDAGRAVRGQWGLSDDDFVVGIVGRVHPAKDQATFLRAVAALVRDHPEMRFVCVGEFRGDYAAEMVRLGEALGLGERIVWAGPRRDMPAVYNAFDLLCSSSVTEGFPNVVGEAMACEVPCVVTDAGDSARLLGDPRRVVPRQQPAALAQAIADVAAEPLDARREEGRRLRERVEANFSVERLLDHTERVLWKD